MMAAERKISIASAGRVLDRLRRGGKKTVVAGALILIMLFMWVRVLIGPQPAGAAAAAPPQQTETAPLKRLVPVKPVELPRVPGRHDAISRDFFTANNRTGDGWTTAGRNTGTEREVAVTSSPYALEVIQRVARTLKLAAVLWSESPRVFLNDRLLGVGEKLTVKDGTGALEFEVLQIYVDSVLVGCRGVPVMLPLTQYLEVVN